MIQNVPDSVGGLRMEDIFESKSSFNSIYVEIPYFIRVC